MSQFVAKSHCQGYLPGHPRDAEHCEVHSCPGTATCYYRYDREFWVTINPFESSYPIAGNTELIPEDEGNEPSGGIEAERLSYWNSKLPPKPEDYDNFEDYWKDYQEWRGKTCQETPVIPLINKSLTICFDNPLLPIFGQLFPMCLLFNRRQGRKTGSSDIMFLKGDFSVEDLQTEWKKAVTRETQHRQNESVLYFPTWKKCGAFRNNSITYLPPEILNSNNRNQPDQSRNIPIKSAVSCQTPISWDRLLVRLCRQSNL
jgi:hypothetical protein